MAIELKNVSHMYSDGPFSTSAIQNVNLTVSEGEFVVILGHTGSGKSTLIQHMNGLLTPCGDNQDNGTVLIDGENMNGEGANKRRIRQKVGLVFQYPEYQLFEETVAKDIAFGPKNQNLSQEEIDSRVKEAMEFVHLDYNTYAERSPFELSGGQMRRVAIAGVLAMKPKYLILDEPTAGLDPEGRDKILGMIKELHEAGKITVIMVSHNMDDAAKLATRIVVLYHGKIVMNDTPRNVFSHVEELQKIGLDVPEAAKLCHALRAKGFDIADNLYTMEEMKNAITSLYAASKEDDN